MDNLSTKIKTGLKWNIINEVVSKVVFVGFSFYLARLLGPEVYGILVILTIFSGLAIMLVDFGFTSSIIYFKDLDNKKKSTIFWMNFFISVVLYLTFVFFAPVIAEFYSNPNLILYIRIIMLVLVFSGLGAVQSALLSKDINFKLKIIFSWSATALSYAVAFYMVHLGYTIESLIAQILVFNFFNTVFLWYITRWIPLLHFSIEDLRHVFGYSSKILYTNMLNYVSSNSDNFIISRMLGDTALGIYNRAFTTVAMPITSISGVFNKVLFPAFSIINDDMPKFRAYYLKTIGLISFVMFPIMLGLLIIAEEFIMLVLGDAWLASIPIMQLFCLMGIVRSLLFVNGIIYNATGNTKLAIKVLLVTNAVFIPVWIITLTYFDLNTMVMVYCVLQFLIAYPLFNITLSLIDLRVKDLIKEVVRPLIGSLFFFVVYLIFELSLINLSLLTVLVLKIGLSFIIYFLYTLVFQKSKVKVFREFLKK